MLIDTDVLICDEKTGTDQNGANLSSRRFKIHRLES